MAATIGTMFLLSRLSSDSGKSREEEQTDYGKNNEAKGKHGSFLLDTMHLEVILQLYIDRRFYSIKSKDQFY